jgi:hypothetical protein
MASRTYVLASLSFSDNNQKKRLSDLSASSNTESDSKNDLRCTSPVDSNSVAKTKDANEKKNVINKSFFATKKFTIF